MDWHLNPAAHVVVVGDRANPVVADMRRAARATYRPRKVVTLLETSAPGAPLPVELRAMIDGKSPRAYVCVGTRCGPPADTPAALAEILATFK